MNQVLMSNMLQKTDTELDEKVEDMLNNEGYSKK